LNRNIFIRRVDKGELIRVHGYPHPMFIYEISDIPEFTPENVLPGECADLM
jgi:hypothetical protein